MNIVLRIGTAQMLGRRLYELDTDVFVTMNYTDFVRNSGERAIIYYWQ